MLLIPRAQKS